jgi:hypothetical protein
MHFEHIKLLEDYLAQVEAKLFCKNNRVAVDFPPDAVSPWNAPALALANEKLLKRASGSANLYAIFTATCDAATPCLRYIGKTTKSLARQRIRNHLFSKHEKTGSKLAQVQAHTCGGGTVEIAWVGIEPESLRNYLEEELIRRHPEADWNGAGWVPAMETVPEADAIEA